MRTNFLLTKSEVQKIFFLFLAWRVLLFCVSLLAPLFLAYQPSFPYSSTLLTNFGLPQWLYSWAGFDGVHYLTIAQKGYKGTALIQAFFPIYPLLMYAVNQVIHNLLLTGLLLSNISLLGTLYSFYYLVKLKFTPAIAWKSLLLFLVFPTSFFLGAVYNESLFLWAVFMSLIFAAKKQWLYAGLMALVITATRIVGIFIIPLLLLELLLDGKRSYAVLSKELIQTTLQQIIYGIRNNFHQFLAVLLGMLGIGFYLLYLQIVFNDPLYFLHVQSEFGSGRQETLILLPQVIWRAIKIIYTVPFNIRWWSYLQELLLTITTYLLLFVGFRKNYNIPYSWLLFSLLAITLPTTTGTLSSMPRYVLVAFPIFVLLAQLKVSHTIWMLCLSLLSILLICNTILFIQGYWVA